MGKSIEKALPILVIEDDNGRITYFHNWLLPGFRIVPTTSAGSALGLLERDKGRVYAGICLDHDLQGQAKTEKDRDLSGTTVVQNLIRCMDKSIPILVHSMNPKRAPVMVNMLRSSGFEDVTRKPMGDMSKDFFQVWLGKVREAHEIWLEEQED